MATKRKKNDSGRSKSSKSGKKNVRKIQDPIKTSTRKSKSKVEAEGIINLTRDGFGFVSRWINNDIFIHIRKMRGALHGDRVKILIPKNIDPKARRIEGEVVHIIEDRANPISEFCILWENRYGLSWRAAICHTIYEYR